MKKQSPATVLYVHSSDEMYGADFILLQLASGLDPERFRPIVVLPTDIPYSGQLTDALKSRGIRTVHFKMAVLRRKYFTPWGFILYLKRLISSVIFLVRFIRKERVDIVQTNTAAVIAGALAARFSGRPHIWHIHEIVEKPAFLRLWLSRLVPRFSDLTVAVSDATRRHLCRGCTHSPGTITVIHNGIGADRFIHAAGAGTSVRQQWGLSDTDMLVGMIGRISHWKGQEAFLQSARHVLQTVPGARFAIVGGTLPGREHLFDNLRMTAQRLGVAHAVIISDFRDDIPAVMDAFDVFVLPSTQPDPFPTVVLEAMAASRPVVAFASGGCIEMIQHDVTGVLVSPNNAVEMAKAICRLLEDRRTRMQMGARAHERVSSLFSPEAFLDRWNAVYEQFLHDAQLHFE